MFKLLKFLLDQLERSSWSSFLLDQPEQLDHIGCSSFYLINPFWKSRKAFPLDFEQRLISPKRQKWMTSRFFGDTDEMLEKYFPYDSQENQEKHDFCQE